MPRGGSKGGSRGFVKSKLGKRHKKTKSSEVTVSEKALKKKVDRKRMKTSRVTDDSIGGLRESDLASFDRSLRNPREADWDSDEGSEVSTSLSVFSELSIGDRATDSTKQQAAYDELTEHFADIESKDASVRIEAYGCLIHALGERVFDDFLMDGGHLDDVGFAVSDSLKKGGSLEIVHALKCARLVAVSLQTKGHLFYTHLKRPLITAITDHSELRVRLAAIDCLTCLLWCSDMSHTESLNVIAMFEQIWKQPSKHYDPSIMPSDGDDPEDSTAMDVPTEKLQALNLRGRVPIELRTSALENFTWLLCQMDGMSLASIADEYTEPILDVLLEENPSGGGRRGKALNAKGEADLRCAAAECLCLLGSCVRSARRSHSGDHRMNDDSLTAVMESDDDQGYYDGGRSDHDGDDDDGPFASDFDASYIHSLMVDIREQGSSHSKSGVNRAMKMRFREYCRSMDGEWAPRVSIKLRASKFELNDWLACIPYRRVKSVLSGGFQIHLLCNDKVQSWFGINEITHAKSLSVAEKEHRRAQYNSAEKDTKRDRKQKRKSKKAFMFQDPG